MPAYLLAWIQGLMQTARDTYRVDPVVFLAIYLACAPLWYFSMFRMLRALAGRRVQQVVLWSTMFLCATVAPFIYVILFGRNIPWWVYGLIAILIGEGVWSLITKSRQRPLQQ
jgi:hypothetical protein